MFLHHVLFQRFEQPFGETEFEGWAAAKGELLLLQVDGSEAGGVDEVAPAEAVEGIGA